MHVIGVLSCLSWFVKTGHIPATLSQPLIWSPLHPAELQTLHHSRATQHWMTLLFDSPTISAQEGEVTLFNDDDSGGSVSIEDEKLSRQSGADLSVQLDSPRNPIRPSTDCLSFPTVHQSTPKSSAAAAQLLGNRPAIHVDRIISPSSTSSGSVSWRPTFPLLSRLSLAIPALQRAFLCVSVLGGNITRRTNNSHRRG